MNLKKEKERRVGSRMVKATRRGTRRSGVVFYEKATYVARKDRGDGDRCIRH